MSPEEAAYKVMLEISQTLSECGEFVVVGGWVPELQFPQKGHAGSIDVDVVLPPGKFALHINLHEHLQNNGYTRSDKPTPTRYLRSIPGLKEDVAVDLMTTPAHQGMKISEAYFGGIQVGSLPGLDLALNCHYVLAIQGEDTRGELRKISIKVVRPEAFILIKSYPLDRRSKAKDAYDIAFVLQHYQPSLQHLAVKMAPLIETESGSEAYELLCRQFADFDSEGPRKVAEFAREIGQTPEQLQQAAFQDAQELFRCVRLARGEF